MNDELSRFIDYAKDSTVLSDREAEVWVRYKTGMSADEIADSLDISTKTVNRHKSRANDRIDKSKSLVEMQDDGKVRRRIGSSTDLIQLRNRESEFNVVLYEVFDGENTSYTIETNRDATMVSGLNLKHENFYVYNLSSEDNLRKEFNDGKLYDSIEQAAVVYDAITDAFNWEPFEDAVPLKEIPRKPEIKSAPQNSSLISKEQADKLLEKINTISDSEQLYLGHGQNDIPFYIDIEGRHIVTAGMIGSGKTYSNKLLAQRILQNTNLNVIMIDPLKGFEEFVRDRDGVMNTYEAGDEIDFGGQLTYIYYGETGMDEFTDDTNLFGQISEKVQNSDEKTVVIVDEAHYFEDRSKEDLWELFGGDSLYSLVTTTQVPHSWGDDSTELGYDFLGEDGLVLFKTPSLDWDGIPDSIENYVHQAKQGTEERGYAEAVIFPPGSSSGTPVKIYREEDEKYIH